MEDKKITDIMKNDELPDEFKSETKGTSILKIPGYNIITEILRT